MKYDYNVKTFMYVMALKKYSVQRIADKERQKKTTTTTGCLLCVSSDCLSLFFYNNNVYHKIAIPLYFK